MAYDHRPEVAVRRRIAQDLRAEAERARDAAEKKARELEAVARRWDEEADHVERMCTRGG